MHPNASEAETAPPRVLAICGGGNAGHAIAVVASAHFDGDVVWLTSCQEKARLLCDNVFSPEGLQSTGVITGRADRVRAISADPAEIIPSADLVLIAVPAFAHAFFLERIAPHLKQTAVVGCLPTRGGFEFEATRMIGGVEPHGKRAIFGLQTLPWSTRVQQPGKVVNFGAHKATVLMAALPRRRAGEIASLVGGILDTKLEPTESFLNMTLGNPGQFVHPGIMYGFFAAWSGQSYHENGIPKFYADVSDQTGDFVEQLSAEALAVARKIQDESNGELNLSGVLSILEWLRVTYPTQTNDTRTAATCFRTGPLQHRKAPMLEVAPDTFIPNFWYRYLTEDVPFGLAVVRAIAQVVGVPTPAIDTVVRWTQERLGKEYMLNGSLDGADAHELPIPQNAGVTTLRGLVDWYAAWQ